jgi:superfamily II DNA or RNA helicase
MDYDNFIKSKSADVITKGFDVNKNLLPDQLKQFQIDIVSWACKRGSAAIFADTGLGKTIMQLSWAHQVSKHIGKPVLILAPLCVAQQTVREGDKFGIESVYLRDGYSDKNIHVTNYEMLKNFNAENYGGIVVDESSILKGMNGKIRKQITDFARKIPYKLSCTATPSPNDFMELGTQCEFLGIMTQTEMLATFFIHDGSDTSKWRLKGHGKFKFWEWMATWSIVIRSPEDLGYKDDGYNLPPLRLHEHIVETETNQDDLFVTVAQGLLERNRARKDSVKSRCKKAAEIMSNYDTCIAWCNLNDESELISGLADSVEITGAMDSEVKEKRILDFTNSEIKSITTKPKIAGFGLNWQHCNAMVFVGLSDSFESFYQAVRRCWRFGQQKPVDVHIVVSDREGAVLENIRRKQKNHDEMSIKMAEIMRNFTISQIKGAEVEKADYLPQESLTLPSFI